MLTRIISGVIGAVLIIQIILFDSKVPILLSIIVMIAGVLSVSEIFSAMGLIKCYKIFIPSMLFAIFLPFIKSDIYGQITWYVYTLVIFGLMILFSSEISVKDVAYTYSMTSLIVMSLRFLIELRDFGGGEFGGFFSIVALGTAWLSDTGAYFSGSFFGKHKLCEKISPKKTVEGAIGGLLFCILTLNMISLLFQKFVFQRDVIINHWLLTAIAVLGSIVSIIGDLSFSLIKRGCHIKDFGNVIPGHGGILDRFDSVIFVVPFVYIMIRFLSLVRI